MPLKEIFQKKVYDPVTALVPGVDPEVRRRLIEELNNSGDPTFSKPESEEKIIFKLPGIRLTKRIIVK